ncbi:hypothetical protein [Thermococcus sp. Bubb.Bath]|uniref:hypothetical protein n=1 Tax=Thermococcus sp. Bubb.Bath TaxID=1638242 RepID=UPI00143BB38C|nr:hypothetical protein [Thermococcus sp. Bubb.Bath]NJF25857.1 hypothetical protein [Thermococcus sp. Bubb.Bath]
MSSLEAISNYTLAMRTYLNVSAVVESSGVVRMENVSLVSNTSAAFDIPSREMEMNISAYTFPAGGRSFTRIVLVGDTAYVHSFGNWSVLHRGEEGFSPIFNTFEHNPIDLVLDAIQSGSCTFGGTPENGSVVCTGEGVLSQVVLLAVGAPDGSSVEVHSGEIELNFLNGKPTGGYLEVSFRISSSGSVRLTQEGVLHQEFTIGMINEGEKIEPPFTG